MKNKALKLTVALTALLTAPSAFADYDDPTDGWYFSGGLGASSTHEETYRSKTGPVYNLDADFDWGWMGSGAIGYDYGNFIRNEIELSYRDNDMDSLQATAGATGHAKALGIMYNLLFDVNVFGPEFTPYIGGGLGMIRLDIESNPLGTSAVSDSDWVPAYQGIIGAEYLLDPNLSLFGDYRYMQSFDAGYKTAAGNKGEFIYKNSTVMAGLRYSFGADMPAAPAPTPVPVAAPQVAPQLPPQQTAYAPEPQPAPRVSRKYNVFFDLMNSNISPEAAQVIRQAAQDAVNGNAVSMKVIGHTDTSGSQEYNQRLSERRADAVKTALGKLGINPELVDMNATGEAELLVPTADGVREPQNRRAEIVFVADGV